MTKQLTPEAIGRIRGNYKVLGQLMAAFYKHQKTIEGWIDNNDIRLSLPVAVDIITKGTGLSEKELFRVPKVAA